MAVSTLIAATKAPTGSGNVNFGSVVNKFAVLVNTTAPGAALPPFTWTVSWDGLLYTPAAPAAQRGNVFVFDVPALIVTASFESNPGAAQIVAQVVPYTD